MVTSPSSLLSIITFISVLGLLLSNVDARPATIRDSRIDLRAAFDPSTFTTESMITDSSGATFNETCTVTLTPIVVNGQDQVQQVTVCVLTPVSGSASPPGGTASATTAVVSSVAATRTASLPSTSSVSTASTPVSALPAAFSILGDSSVTISSGAGASATPSASGAPATSNTSPTKASSSKAGTSTTSVAATASPLGAASSQSPAQFSLPGKTLAVLPIGLGVFAGISVIALIVVGWVTYERTKYRKAFRARKLAEARGAMGYGGMAEALV